MNGWIILVLAITLEVAGTTCMKLSDGFSKPLPSMGVVLFYAGAIYSLTMALKTIPMNSAYAIWSGLGTALAATIGFTLFAESFSVLRIVSLLLIVAGVAGLNLAK